jgi:polar amino acid transport system permease protein
MNWDWDFAREILPDLLDGLITTLWVSVLAAAIALFGGLAIAVFSSVTGRVGRGLAWMLVEFCRGMPIVVALYFGFFALPELGVTLSAFAVGVLVLGVLYAAYCSEVYRGALLSIPPGMKDACVALGLPAHVTWRRILVPLAVRRSAPALMNYVLIMYRESALLFAIGVPVLLAKAQVVGDQSYRYLEPYTIVGLIYLALNMPVVLFLHRYERRHRSASI